MARNPIDRLIEAKEAKVASAERALEKLKIELSVLREAREAVAESASNGKAKSAPIKSGKRGRSISAQWKLVLIDIARKGNAGASLDEIQQLCRQHGIDLKRPTLRAQMSNYVKRTYLGRAPNGNFFIALNGLTVAGLQSAPPTIDLPISGESSEADRDPALTGSRGEWR